MGILKKVLDHTVELRNQGITPKVYFDLDSTLFNVKPRLKKIIQEFGHLDEVVLKYPDASKVLKAIQEVAESYHLKEHLQYLGLHDHPKEFYVELFNYWNDRFFHSDYLIEDTPYDGAVEYVNELHDKGAMVVYLTGRDVLRMENGSYESLKKWKFPINTELSKLVLKPHKDLDDAEFKRDHFNELQDKQTPIWFFENEPHNIHLILSDCPHVKVVYFDSVHSGRSSPPLGLPTIRDFRR